jgi:hypothetical protein
MGAALERGLDLDTHRIGFLMHPRSTIFRRRTGGGEVK